MCICVLASSVIIFGVIQLRAIYTKTCTLIAVNIQPHLYDEAFYAMVFSEAIGEPM